MIDVAISYDTTGSMWPCITETRRKIESMVEDLFRNIPGIRIALIAHGDYCDKDNPYTIVYQDFTTDKSKLIHFIKTIKDTHGGDADECYELVLKTARTLNWQSGKSKALVVIGDANPHGVNYDLNREKLDWRNEAALLAEAGIQIYGCHAMASIRQSSRRFYESIASIGRGVYVTLAQFATLPALLMGIVYKQNEMSQFEEYVRQLDSRDAITRDLHESLTAMGATSMKPLRTASRSYTTHTRPTGYVRSLKPVSAELAPVPSSRFQIFEIDRPQKIQDFVTAQAIMFQKGRGFYQLIKHVEVQQYKEIILVDKRTRDIFSGAPVREFLGLKPQTDRGGVTENLSSKSLLADYDVFIQSTSYNRKLLPNTLFMYEVDGWEKDVTEMPAAAEAARPAVAPSAPPSAPVAAEKKAAEAVPVGASAVAPSSFAAMMTAVKEDRGFPVVPAAAAEIPESLKKPKAAYDLRKKDPSMSWEKIAAATGYGSDSGARKAAKRYEASISAA